MLNTDTILDDLDFSAEAMRPTKRTGRIVRAGVTLYNVTLGARRIANRKPLAVAQAIANSVGGTIEVAS